MHIRWLLIGAVVAALSAWGAAAQHPVVALRSVTIVPMTGTRPLFDATVIVEGDRIRAPWLCG